MASILRSKAIKSVTKGNTSAYYSYVEEKNGTNPVIQQLEKELSDYMGFIKKKNSGLLKPGEHGPCKVSDALFDIWNKFEPRVTPRFFYQKLMELGEYLVANREYTTASWQCYDRYLNLITNVNIENIQKIEDLRRHFFSNGISNQDNSDMTFRALMGHCICMFHFTIAQDPKLQISSSIQSIAETMRILRLIMQLLFEVDQFCWLVYNATIYMYTIGRYMMQYGHSKIVLEYFVFCCLSMECSVPLLGVKYLSWRTTLYAATCQCYYDCKLNDDGELFARRSLSKISELHELECASVTGEKGINMPQFREATIKIGCVLFKRLVFESRRKTRGIMRSKNRLGIKDLSNQSWPRTPVEKILYEMFDCSAAQYLAIEEALCDSNRRIGMPGPAGNEYEPEMLDVVLELLYAADYLANGGGGKGPLSNDLLSDFKAIVSDNKSQLSMAIEGENKIQLRNFLKAIKYSFNYEAWEIFRKMAQNTLNFIQSDAILAVVYKSDVQIIYLLQAMDKYLIHVRKIKHLKNEALKANIAEAKSKAKQAEAKGDEDTVSKMNIPKSSKASVAGTEDANKKSKSTIKASNLGTSKGDLTDKEDLADGEGASSPSSSEPGKEEDLLVNIAVRLIQIIDLSIRPEQTDIDVVVDITLLLWRKVRDVLQKYQNGSQDNYKWVSKLDSFPKWLFILNVVHSSMSYFNIAAIDPAVFGHCSLRLGLAYEALANVNYRKLMKDSASLVETDDQTSITRTNQTRLNFFELTDGLNERFGVSTDVRGNLLKAKSIIKTGLVSMASARAATSRTDKTFLCDKEYNEDTTDIGLKTSTKTSTSQAKIEKLKALKEKTFKYQKNVQSDLVPHLIADLHVELIFLYQKISVRLIENKGSKPGDKNNELNFEKEFDLLMKECKKNKISQALLVLAKAQCLNNFIFVDNNKLKAEQKSLVEKAYQKLLKAEAEDKMLYEKHVKVDVKETVKAKIPPAPVVCLKTFNKIVIQPRNFESLDGTKACWYRIFASVATSVNAKARISDYTYPGCGDQIPANNNEKVAISGLSHDEQYIFAVAAYDRNGNLIGESIGDSTDPILSSNTLSILMTWAYLCQICYQIGEFELALTAFEVLWNNFIIKPIEPKKETMIYKNEVDYEVCFHQINYNIVEKTSPILLRKFLESFFIVSDIQVKRKKFSAIYYSMEKFSTTIRIKECEKLLVAIDLAGWLNDPQIILQAVVQIYGLLAPLIYFNLAYEPMIQVLSHCLLVLEDLPSSIFQRKPKSMFESLQHMIACSTFYLTDVLKRFNKKALSNFFNLVGRKLLGTDEASSSLFELEENTEMEENTEVKKKKVKGDDKGPTTKQTEIKALEIHLGKSNIANKNVFSNMLTGNEDISQIFAFVTNNPCKTAYKELAKFRRRNNFLEIFTYLLQKALGEELTQEVSDWSVETIEWIQKRNANILGIQLKKDKQIALEMSSEAGASLTNINNVTQATTGTVTTKKNRKRKIKKYKLLIPLELDMNEKIKLEERQKAAIDILYDLIPDMYDKWTRRKKLRKIFQEESAFKSQFYVILALNNFSQLMNRLETSSTQNRTNFMERFYSSSYLDPGMFLFDKINALLVNFDEYDLVNDPMMQKAKRSEMIRLGMPSKSTSSKSSASSSDSDKLFEIKDTADLISEVLTGLDGFYLKDDSNKSYSSTDSQRTHVRSAEFVEFASNIFNKFKTATVIAYRGKQWTQLQNACRLMFNCINSFMHIIPAVTFNGKKMFKIRDLWRSLAPAIYIAADNLLEMLFVTFPIEKTFVKDIQNKINKWYDSDTIGKSGSSLKFDVPLDDISSLDLRFIKEFIFRAVHCLASLEKWEKTAYIAMKFNAMTSYKYAEQLSPVIAFAQNKLIEQVARFGKNKVQPHLENLKAELGRYPKIEDLFFINFKIELDASKIKKVELGTRIDPRTHNNYPNENKAKELISVPLDVEQTLTDFHKSLENTFYASRVLLHSRRLLSLYLLSQTPQIDFFGVTTDTEFVNVKSSMGYDDMHVGFEKVNSSSQMTKKSVDYENISEFFHSNPINYTNKEFKRPDEVFIKEIKVDLDTLIESYSKTISVLFAYKENDLAIQAMHELGNIYHFSKDLENAYKNWNEALDSLTGVKHSLINWRNEFSDPETRAVDFEKILKKCGIWGCLLGGVLTAKMAQYYLASDLELKTECCLYSATFFKCIFRASVPYPRHDIDYIKDDLEFLNTDYLLPGLLFNNEIYRFDIRYVIAALNFISLELLNAGHYLYIMPTLALYEYFAKTLSRDLTHTVFARMIKIEALTKLNFFTEAIAMLNSIHKGEKLPHFIDDKNKNYHTGVKYNDFPWCCSKPIYDLNNLKSLETVLSLKLPLNIIKAYGPHLTCRFYLVQCKLFIQMASCLPCTPNFDEFHECELFHFHDSFVLNTNVETSQIFKLQTSFGSKKPNTDKNTNPQDDNPDVVKVFSKATKPLSLQFIKGCLLGTCKTVLTKCLVTFSEDFPKADKYFVSSYWQKEFKYECNLLMASIADQSQLGYLALQHIVEAMKELAAVEENSDNTKKTLISALKKQKHNIPKQLRINKKGVYQVFDLISKSHMNTRLWLKARIQFVQCMFNQLNDAGKAKGIDENIVRDFGDLKYYCDKCIEETDKFYDMESKGFFQFIESSLDLIRGANLKNCLSKLENCLLNFLKCPQLSLDGLINYLKAVFLKTDLNYTVNLLDSSAKLNLANTFDTAMENLLNIQKVILNDLKSNGGEIIECYVDKNKSYFNNIQKEIRNIYNPLFHYLVHAKLRLGSCLMLKSAFYDCLPEDAQGKATMLWQHSLNILNSGIELNKVICERSISLEIELNYKYSHCVRELFMTRQMGTLLDVVEAYGYTINLLNYSTHDLNLIKNCYLELAIAFISNFEPSIIADYSKRNNQGLIVSNVTSNLTSANQTPVSSAKPGSKLKKNVALTNKATEGALTALAFAIKTSMAIREKMLLTGHKSIKNMSSINALNCPKFVQSDLLGYFVFAERKKIYRDEIEEEILSLAPEFEIKEGFRSLDDKIEQLAKESDKSITWIHIINYQAKLQNLSSMRNLNTLKNGKNRYKYSEFFTIGFAPILKNCHIMAARLHDLNFYLKNNLDIYKNECQANDPINEFFRNYAKKNISTAGSARSNTNIKALLEYVKVFSGNLASCMTSVNYPANELGLNESVRDSLVSSQSNKPNVTIVDWSYLQTWPANYDFNIQVSGLGKINENSTYDSFAEYMLTLNWYKNLVVLDEDAVNRNEDDLMAVIAVRDPLTSNKIKFRNISAEKVIEIHDKLAPLATIADTAIEQAKNTEGEVNSEFLNSLRGCLGMIANLFDKKYDPNEKKIPFELLASNVVDLERMFDVNFGSYTNNESLKNYILNLFI